MITGRQVNNILTKSNISFCSAPWDDRPSYTGASRQSRGDSSDIYGGLGWTGLVISQVVGNHELAA